MKRKQSTRNRWCKRDNGEIRTTMDEWTRDDGVSEVEDRGRRRLGFRQVQEGKMNNERIWCFKIWNCDTRFVYVYMV